MAEFSVKIKRVLEQESEVTLSIKGMSQWAVGEVASSLEEVLREIVESDADSVTWGSEDEEITIESVRYTGE